MYLRISFGLNRVWVSNLSSGTHLYPNIGRLPSPGNRHLLNLTELRPSSSFREQISEHPNEIYHKEIKTLKHITKQIRFHDLSSTFKFANEIRRSYHTNETSSADVLPGGGTPHIKRGGDARQKF